MPKATSLGNLAEDIMQIVHVYRSSVLVAIADHMDECSEVFMKNAKLPPESGGSPYDVDNTSSKHYRDCWKVKPMKKAKFVRYIGNTKKVKAKKNSDKTIPLINILEYGTHHNSHPHVDRILDKSKDEIVDIIVKNIPKGR